MRFLTIIFAPALALACGCGHSSPKEADLSGASDDFSHTDIPMRDLFDAAIVPNGSNTVPLVVDNGVKLGSFDVAYVSVTLCPPGSASECQTIDHVAVDTASVGLRILASEIEPTLVAQLPHVQDTSGNAISECYTYADGFAYGSIVTTDLVIGEEHAPNMAFQLVGDLTAVPSDCAASGENEDTVATFGYKGVLGVAPFGPDCGTACNTAGTSKNPLYYTCPSGTCASAAIATSAQVQNPVTQFAQDNNGVVVELPTIDDTMGTPGVDGTLTFGVGTRSNNAVGSAHIYQATDSGGLATITANVTGFPAFPDGIFDTGTSLFAMSVGLPTCSIITQYVCPTNTASFTATLTDAKSSTGTINFKIANAASLFAADSQAAAFNDLGGPGVDNLFIIGLPFFFGHKIFFAIDGATTPSGAGPYYAL